MPLEQLRIIPFPSQSTSDPPSICTLPTLLKPISPSGQFNPTDNLTSDGRPKAKEADSLKSYTDYTRMHSHLRSKNIRDAALLTIGIATGLRCSDLLSLQIGHLIEQDLITGNSKFKDTIDIYEKKTGKRTCSSEDCIFITEAIKLAATELINSYTSKGKNKFFSLDDYLFQSKQPQRSEYVEDEDGNQVPNPLYGKYIFTVAGAHKSFKEAQRSLDIPYNIGTHTMRKTFGGLYFEFSRRSPTANGAAMEDTKRALRQANTRTTERYLSVTINRSRKIREMISDWLLGKAEFDVIAGED